MFGALGGWLKLKPCLGLSIAIEVKGHDSFRADRFNVVNGIGHKTDNFTGRQDLLAHGFNFVGIFPIPHSPPEGVFFLAFENGNHPPGTVVMDGRYYTGGKANILNRQGIANLVVEGEDGVTGMGFGFKKLGLHPVRIGDQLPYLHPDLGQKIPLFRLTAGLGQQVYHLGQKTVQVVMFPN